MIPMRPLALLLAAAAAPLAAATPAAAAQPGSPAPPDRQAAPDTSSTDSTIAALYATISGPPGPRDWNRLRALLRPGAIFAVSSPDTAGKTVLRQLSVDDYIARATPILAKEGFYESAMATWTHRFGNIAQAFSAYASRHLPTEKPFQRGINSIQLINDGTRWWIVSIIWDRERPGNPIPSAMQRD